MSRDINSAFDWCCGQDGQHVRGRMPVLRNEAASDLADQTPASDERKRKKLMRGLASPTVLNVGDDEADGVPLGLEPE